MKKNISRQDEVAPKLASQTTRAEAGLEARMTEDALAELRRSGFSRRHFLKGSGALVVAFSVAEFADRLGIAPETDARAGRQYAADARLLDRDRNDGAVTVYTGRADMGQGMSTVQTQLIAEELSVPVNRVRLVQCDTGMTPDQGTSSGQSGTSREFQSREPRAGGRDGP